MEATTETTMSDMGWNDLPFIPLKYILEHLSVTNAMAAMSTCRQWRQAMLLYEGRREMVRLRAKNLEQNLFVARLFKKHAQILQVFVNCGEEELNKFMNYVLPEFFDTKALKELVFIGPMYVKHNKTAPMATLKRIILESLIVKHANFIQRIGFLGCQLDNGSNDDDRYVHKQVTLYSKELTYTGVTSPEDSILTRSNADIMALSSLKHIILDYELASTEAVESLAPLKNLKLLSLNVAYRQHSTYHPIDWERVNGKFQTPLEVAVNVINVPIKTLKYVMEGVFQAGMKLASLKVMFCNTLYVALIHRIGLLYNTTLREVVWVDSPFDGAENDRAVRCPPDTIISEVFEHGNPFILLSWQCLKLRRLAIHGYWLWQYDVLGLARLRELKLEVSSLFSTQTRFTRAASAPNCALRVMLYDTPITVDSQFIRDMAAVSHSVAWRPIQWRRLPPGLRANASPASRAYYIIQEVTHPLGIT